MATVDISSHVYVGIWTNWALGPVMGQTLTLPRDKGNLLIAFTASFIAIVATRFWLLLCVLLHRQCSSSSNRTTLHQQRQVALRNSSGPDAFAWTMLTVILSWWKVGGSAGLRRLLILIGPVLGLSLFVWVGFTVAGGFSSSLATDNEPLVLLNSVDCGFMTTQIGQTVPDEVELLVAADAEAAVRIDNAANYAAQCYSADALGIMDCGRFTQPRLSYSVDRSAPCPFADEMCRRGGNNSLRLDTGLITTRDLGLNLPLDEEAAVRTVMHCAPLRTEGYTSQARFANSSVVRYEYGPAYALDNESQPTTEAWTFQVEDIATQYQWNASPGRDLLFGRNLRLSFMSSMVSNHTLVEWPTTFIPVAPMVRYDGDTFLFFLSGNGVIFPQPWDDDWYRGTVETQVHLTYAEQYAETAYLPEEAASPLACVQQFQFCNLARPGSTGCGPLTSLNDALIDAGPYFNASHLESVMDEEALTGNREASRLYWIAMMTGSNSIGVANIVGHMGSKALASQKWLLQGKQSFIGSPVPQWQTDAENWFAIGLSNLQLGAVYVPIGAATGGATDPRLRIPPASAYQEALCGSQMVRDSRYTSFSVFGLCFTYVLGGLIVLLSAVLEPALQYLYRRRGFQAHRSVEWTMNGILQLHRLAHEELGYGEWASCDEEVPNTQHDAELGGICMDDKTHPRIGVVCYRSEFEGKAEDIGENSKQAREQTTSLEHHEKRIQP